MALALDHTQSLVPETSSPARRASSRFGQMSMLPPTNLCPSPEMLSKDSGCLWIRLLEKDFTRSCSNHVCQNEMLWGAVNGDTHQRAHNLSWLLAVVGSLRLSRRAGPCCSPLGGQHVRSSKRAVCAWTSGIPGHAYHADLKAPLPMVNLCWITMFGVAEEEERS